MVFKIIRNNLIIETKSKDEYDDILQILCAGLGYYKEQMTLGLNSITIHNLDAETIYDIKEEIKNTLE